MNIYTFKQLNNLLFMKKLILVFATSLLLIFTANAQNTDYKTAVGLRAGLSAGLTAKHFLSKQGAIEGLVSSRWGGLNITGLYEVHNPAFDEPGLRWYYGAGGHIGFWDGNKNPWFNDNDNHAVIGVDLILGMEYTIPGSPVNLSLDWKPGFNIVGYSGFWGDEFALSLRFAFQ